MEAAAFPAFFEGQPSLRKGAVPVRRLAVTGADGKQQERLVTTVFDILAASLAIDRGQGGDVASGYEDARAYATPAVAGGDHRRPRPRI